MKRKDVLKTIAVASAAGAALIASTGAAEAGMSQKLAGYTNKAPGKQMCDSCKFFVPGASKSATGTCQIVSGKISPKGWCKYYQAK